MMKDGVLCADGSETIAAEIADTLRKARAETRELQVLPVVDDQLRDVGKAQHVLERKAIIGNDTELFNDEFAQIVGHARIDREADHVAAPPPRERGSAGAPEITTEELRGG